MSSNYTIIWEMRAKYLFGRNPIVVEPFEIAVLLVGIAICLPVCLGQVAFVCLLVHGLTLFAVRTNVSRG